MQWACIREVQALIGHDIRFVYAVIACAGAIDSPAAPRHKVIPVKTSLVALHDDDDAALGGGVDGPVAVAYIEGAEARVVVLPQLPSTVVAVQVPSPCIWEDFRAEALLHDFFLFVVKVFSAAQLDVVQDGRFELIGYYVVCWFPGSPLLVLVDGLPVVALARLHVDEHTGLFVVIAGGYADADPVAAPTTDEHLALGDG